MSSAVSLTIGPSNAKARRFSRGRISADALLRLTRFGRGCQGVGAAVMIARIASWRDMGWRWAAIHASSAARSDGGRASMILVAPTRGRPPRFLAGGAFFSGGGLARVMGIVYMEPIAETTATGRLAGIGGRRVQQ